MFFEAPPVIAIINFNIHKPLIFFLVKWVPGWGPEQRESGKTVLYLLIIITILISNIIRKDCFQNNSKFTTEDHFIKHMNITIGKLKLNEIIYKR